MIMKLYLHVNYRCIHIKYSQHTGGKVEAEIMNWFNNPDIISSSEKFSREVTVGKADTEYSLKKSAQEYVTLIQIDKKTTSTILDINYGHYFKTVSDVGQLLCFKALIKYGIYKNKDDRFNNALHIFHTNDSFCFAIASLLHYGVVYEDPTQIVTDARNIKELIKNINKVSNKIMISKKCYDPESGFRDYQINWHRMFQDPMSKVEFGKLINEAIEKAKKEQTTLLENKYNEIYFKLDRKSSS